MTAKRPRRIIKLIPLEMEHLKAFEASALNTMPDMEDRMKLYKETGPALTAMLDGKPLGAAGAVILWPGVAEAWLITAPATRTRYPVLFHKAVIQGLRWLIKEHGLHRVQATVRADSGLEVADRWIRRLGFEFEGIMKAYTHDGLDCLRYAMIVR